jgi:hypothetical protein
MYLAGTKTIEIVGKFIGLRKICEDIHCRM